MMNLVDLREGHLGQSSIHGANYVPHFQGDRPNYSEPATCAIGSQDALGLGSWEEILEQCTTGFNTVPSHVSVSTSQPACTGVVHEQENLVSGRLLAGESITKEELGNSLSNYSTWQVFNVSCILDFLATPSCIHIQTYMYTYISNSLRRSCLKRPKLKFSSCLYAYDFFFNSFFLFNDEI